MLKDDGTREGPYLIASVVSPGKYTLSEEDGTYVKDREEIAVERLDSV